MNSFTRTAPAGASARRAGWIMAAIAVLFLLFDAVTKLMVVRPVVDAMAQLGYPVARARTIGAVLLVCLALYLMPRTTILGAILLTGFLGGAVATQVRIGNPLVTHVLFPVYVAVLLWGGLYLREDRLRALVPLRR
jgi:hypothetical protein